MPLIELTTGVTLHYVDTNPDDDAVPLLLIHGMLGTPEMHLAQVIERLRPHYRIIAPTVRGYGKSTPEVREFPHDFYQRDTKDMIALLDALNVDRAHVAGYSDGGEISLLMAGLAPERIVSAASWGAIGYYGPKMRPAVQRMYPGDWITPEERETHNIRDVNAFVLGWMHAVQRIIDSGGDLSLSLAEKMTVSVLMMLGRRDKLNPVEYAQKIVERAPQGKLELFDTGHGIHDEDFEGFMRVLCTHLQAAS